jgi:hypothetical protein
MSYREMIVNMFSDKPFIWETKPTEKSAQSKKVRFSKDELKKMGIDLI